jgi:NTE family protein
MGRDVLESPALGTSGSDLIRPCGQVLRAADPPPVRTEPALAVALSGGGFRATLAGIGVLRFLADAGLLERVRYVSSVSGGSVASAIFAAGYPRVRDAGFTGEAFDAHVVRPLVDRISSQSLKSKLMRNAWRVIGPKTRTQLLADAFDDWWLDGRRLTELPDGVRWIINAASVTTGVRFAFERDLVGDYVVGRVPTAETPLRIAEAVASSAAVPGAFAPFVVDGVDFPCAEGRVTKLLDGGVYDNMGLEALDNVPRAFLVAINAGGHFLTGAAYGKLPIVRDLQRANSLLYRQSTAIRRRLMIERFQAWEAARRAGTEPPEWARRGVLFSLATSMEPAAAWTAAELAPGRDSRTAIEDWREELALVPTSFDEFDRDLCRQLLYRGWWLAGANIATYHADLLGDAALPAWRDL